MIKLKRSQCSILPLVLKGKWYDMIATGEKKEEYRADTQYWHRAVGVNIFRACRHPDWGEPKDSHYVVILHGRVQLIDDKKGGAK